MKGGPDLVGPLVPSRFARVDPALEERFRCVYDATENAGLGPLRRALPLGWREAMLHGRTTHPRPQRSTRLGDLLARGARRHVPLATTEAAVGTACKRRRSLKQWCGWADDAVLEGLEETFLEKLANMLGMYAKLRSSALVVSALLDFFTFSLCAPYSETTDGNHFDTLLQIIAGSFVSTDG